jgi:hypothetical protein
VPTSFTGNRVAGPLLWWCSSKWRADLDGLAVEWVRTSIDGRGADADHQLLGPLGDDVGAAFD